MTREVSNAQKATLHVVATQTHDLLLVSLTGELDLACSDLVDNINGLDLASVARITVDLTELEFCDSTGIAAFIRLYEQQGQAGRKVEFTNPQTLVRRTFEVLGIDHLLTP